MSRSPGRTRASPADSGTRWKPFDSRTWKAMKQAEFADRMNISRGTFQRILTSAHAKSRQGSYGRFCPWKYQVGEYCLTKSHNVLASTADHTWARLLRKHFRVKVKMQEMRDLRRRGRLGLVPGVWRKRTFPGQAAKRPRAGRRRNPVPRLDD